MRTKGMQEILQTYKRMKKRIYMSECVNEMNGYVNSQYNLPVHALINIDNLFIVCLHKL